ncbi:phytanoyl-CoA dioxygenase family protein [Bradyrhizobium jicamae]|uniref:Phytanoyl-CoA dioxygenase family protein n=1 Tax=Bradyrhizobium jicamae TaxID=280332 RepID=A0ABS5FY69_9BRAD|nr:phytanoyl-CoA dioxygenase family protein [Bradyrhizobium jicamae]MBR0801196.1 phytanoyl-CoA dioxygenase family protein [Bradyrhizobium jicamae]
MIQLTQTELDRLHSDYERDGYLLVRNALSAEEMAPIQAQWNAARDGLRNGRVVDGMRRDNFYIHGLLPGPVGQVYKHPNVARIVNRLLGEDVALYINRLNVKDTSFNDSIHLHQDIPYFNGGEQKMNVFLALQDINLNNGAMVYVPKSHELGILDRKTIDISAHPELEVLVPSLRPGDLVFAHINLWHSSVPNTQQTDRVLLQMIFQPATDGSYYPLSVPKPTLMSGEWKTETFRPWKTITAATTSQLDKDAMMAAAPAAAAEENPPAVVMAMVGATEVPQSVARSLSRDKLIRQIKPYVPVALRQPLKDLIARRSLPPQTKIVSGHAPAAIRPAAQELPEYFTPSTGPKQVLPLPEHAIDWSSEIKPTIQYLKRAGKLRVLLAACEGVQPNFVNTLQSNGVDVAGYVHVSKSAGDRFSAPDGKPIYQPADISKLEGVDAIIVMATLDFSYIIRKCEQHLRNDIAFVPASAEAIVPEPVRRASVGDWATRSSILTYLYVSGLRGHFAEFGTFWGRAFYGSYFELSHWLQGRFYAFDSFEGLSVPDQRETVYTNGDFIKGAYGYNHISFQALAEILRLPEDRVVTVPGFFDKSLTPAKAEQLGIAPKSLSVVRIDCDLLDPTMSVLEFITPLLDDGALVYFDDWRLCRSDPNVGERGAVIKWLAANPSFELVDFPSIHWQHQWFIFHRSRPARAKNV